MNLGKIRSKLHSAATFMNLIKGIVGKDYVLTEGGVKLPLPKKHGAALGQKVVYGIRPEHLSLGKGIEATISVTEPTGPEIHVYADVGPQEVCAVIRDRQVLKRGSTVQFAPDLAQVHLFDEATGKVVA